MYLIKFELTTFNWGSLAFLCTFFYSCLYLYIYIYFIIYVFYNNTTFFYHWSCLTSQSALVFLSFGTPLVVIYRTFPFTHFFLTVSFFLEPSSSFLSSIICVLYFFFLLNLFLPLFLSSSLPKRTFFFFLGSLSHSPFPLPCLYLSLFPSLTLPLFLPLSLSAYVLLLSPTQPCDRLFTSGINPFEH